MSGPWMSFTVNASWAPPGKPTENGFIEAPERNLRSECLNPNRFTNRAEKAGRLTSARQR